MQEKPTIGEIQKHLLEVRVHIGDTLGELEKMKNGEKVMHVRAEVPSYLFLGAIPRGVEIPSGLIKKAESFYNNWKIHHLDVEINQIKGFGSNPDRMTTEKFIGLAVDHLTKGEVKQLEVEADHYKRKPLTQLKIKSLIRKRFSIEKAYEQFLVHHLKKLGVKTLD
ncbi:hypothetical protein HY989_01360 [Candidatus Micrarchaeota archaeon]|nr:hypothetical protein [Candidatus Micrarchaeota archaeon]